MSVIQYRKKSGIPVSSFDANPASNEWQVFVEDFADNLVATSGTIQFGRATIQTLVSGTGATSFQANSKIDTGSSGVRMFRLPSDAGYYNMSTDVEFFKAGVITTRVGARVQYEDLPASGGENYYHFLGVSSGGTTVPASNFAFIGIRLTDHASNFVVVVDNGSATTAYNTGVAFAADTWYNLEIEVSPTRTKGWVNGALVVDVANVPAANTVMAISPVVAARVGSPSATREFFYDFAYIAFRNPNGRGVLDRGGPF